MDTLKIFADIIEENLDRVIVARLKEDLDMVRGCDADLEHSIERVIRFLSVNLDCDLEV